MVDAASFILNDAGTWDADVDIFVGEAPERSSAVMVAEVTGDRQLRTRFVNETGFNAAALYGVDVDDGSPVAVQVDPASGFVTVGKGDYDEEAGVIVYRFSAELPGRGTVAWREVHRRVSDDEKTFDSWVARGERELHMMSIRYRRQKKG